MSINDNVYFVLMSCQRDAREGSLCRDENNKDVFIFSTDECCFTSVDVCVYVCVCLCVRETQPYPALSTSDGK